MTSRQSIFRIVQFCPENLKCAKSLLFCLERVMFHCIFRSRGSVDRGYCLSERISRFLEKEAQCCKERYWPVLKALSHDRRRGYTQTYTNPLSHDFYAAIS